MNDIYYSRYYAYFMGFQWNNYSFLLVTDGFNLIHPQNSAYFTKTSQPFLIVIMPTLPDYPWVSRMRNESPDLPYGSLYLPYKNHFEPFYILKTLLDCVGSPDWNNFSCSNSLHRFISAPRIVQKITRRMRFLGGGGVDWANSGKCVVDCARWGSCVDPREKNLQILGLWRLATLQGGLFRNISVSRYCVALTAYHLTGLFFY